MYLSEPFVAQVEASLGIWIQAFRISYGCFAGVALLLAMLYIGRGGLPSLLRQSLHFTAAFWPCAYLFVLRDIPQRHVMDHFFGWVWPSLCLFALPDFVNIIMHGSYYVFGWPSSLRALQKRVESRHLEQSFLRGHRQMTK